MKVMIWIPFLSLCQLLQYSCCCPPADCIHCSTSPIFLLPTLPPSLTAMGACTHDIPSTAGSRGRRRWGLVYPIYISITSPSYMYTVIQPAITDPPRPVTTTILSPVNLTCQATGSPDPLFAWFKDNKPIPSARLSHYNLPSVTPDDRGYYHCTATNDGGTDTSDQALLRLVGVRQYRVGFTPSGSSRKKCQSPIDMVCIPHWFIHGWVHVSFSVCIGPH